MKIFESVLNLLGIETVEMRAVRVRRMQAALDIDRWSGEIYYKCSERRGDCYTFDKRAERAHQFARVWRALDTEEMCRYIYGGDESVLAYND